MKLSLTPLSQGLLLFLQLLQSGSPSSHFRCRDLHVRHPVRTRFGLLEPSPSLSPSALVIPSALLFVGAPAFFCFLTGLRPDGRGDSLRFRPGEPVVSPFNVGSDEVGEMVWLSYEAYEASKPGCRYAVWFTATFASVERASSYLRSYLYCIYQGCFQAYGRYRLWWTEPKFARMNSLNCF